MEDTREPQNSGESAAALNGEDAASGATSASASDTSGVSPSTAVTEATASSSASPGASGTDSPAAASSPVGSASASASGTAVPVDMTNDCGQGLLVPGAYPDLSSGKVFACGSVNSKSATGGDVDGLTNDIPYAVAVAGVDDIGNPGPMSNVACGIPKHTNQFYSAYRDAGGKGGGGFCALGHLGHGQVTRGWLVALGAWFCSVVALTTIRLRRRK
jgi:hypothetical protein